MTLQHQRSRLNHLRSDLNSRMHRPTFLGKANQRPKVFVLTLPVADELDLAGRAGLNFDQS